MIFFSRSLYAFSVCVYSRWLSKNEMVFNGEWIDRLGRITHSRRQRLAQSYRCLYEQKTSVCADKLLSVHRAAEFNIVEWKYFFWALMRLSFWKEGTTNLVDVYSCQYAKIWKYSPSVTREIAISIAVIKNRQYYVLYYYSLGKNYQSPE